MAARPVPRDLAASVRARLHNVAKARNVELQLVLSEFAVERLLYRLGVSSLARDGPTLCSGLPVERYTPEGMHEELGSEFRLVDSVREVHITPSGAQQAFVYCLGCLEPTGFAAQGVARAAS